MFRQLKSIPVSYKRQGYIFFLCLNYNYLSEEMKQRIVQLCIDISAEDYRPLFKFLTTNPDEMPAWRIAGEYFIPVNRLYKLRKEFYIKYESKYKYENCA